MVLKKIINKMTMTTIKTTDVVLIGNSARIFMFDPFGLYGFYFQYDIILSDDFDGRPLLDCFADASALFSDEKPEVQSDAG